MLQLQLLQYSGMNPTWPHRLTNIQLVPYNLHVHKHKVIIHPVTVLQIRRQGSPRSVSIIRDQGKKTTACTHLFFTPICQVIIYNKYQSNIFLRPPLAIYVLQKALLV